MPSSDNPLRHATSASWDRLVAATNPASMLVAIGGLMGQSLRRRLEAEDVWQETLLHAWRSREQFEWQGAAAFRHWLLAIARHRIHDLVDHIGAEKRGVDREQRFADRDAVTGSESDEHYAGPCSRTTPGRAAADREAAALFERALGDVADAYRDVVRLRLFEDCTFEEAAERLGLTVEGARYRFLQGVESYRRALRRQRAITPTTPGADWT